MAVTAEFRLEPQGPFSLAASTRFLEGFAPAAYEGGSRHGHLHLAFPVEGSWRSAGACIRQDGPSVVGDVVGNVDSEVVSAHVARILSLDVDGSGFYGVGQRDAVVARLQRTYPGLRPVLFWSPYEAAAWTIIGQRIRIVQAAHVKQGIAEELGEKVVVDGERLHAFPPPNKLVELREYGGVSNRKVGWLQATARAALDGKLDASRLRSAGHEEALASLKELPGIGDFAAELTLVRGAGEPDYFPRHERRLHRTMAEAYGYPRVPAVDVLEHIAERWRPYRSWVSVLFRNELEDRMGEIAGRGGG